MTFKCFKDTIHTAMKKSVLNIMKAKINGMFCSSSVKAKPISPPMEKKYIADIVKVIIKNLIAFFIINNLHNLAA